MGKFRRGQVLKWVSSDVGEFRRRRGGFGRGRV